jgi:hypothetical protein
LTSNVEENAWFVGEHLLFNAKNGAVHLVVDVGKVSSCGALSDTAELVVYGTMAKADPAFVRAQIWHRNAAQVSANSGAAQYR